MSGGQRFQDFTERLGFDWLPRRIFFWRVRWHMWRGRVHSARTEEAE